MKESFFAGLTRPCRAQQWRSKVGPRTKPNRLRGRDSRESLGEPLRVETQYESEELSGIKRRPETTRIQRKGEKDRVRLKEAGEDSSGEAEQRLTVKQHGGPGKWRKTGSGVGSLYTDRWLALGKSLKLWVSDSSLKNGLKRWGYVAEPLAGGNEKM